MIKSVLIKFVMGKKQSNYFCFYFFCSDNHPDYSGLCTLFSLLKSKSLKSK